MRCSKCGIALPDDSVFCSGCGAKIQRNVVVCQKCGAELPAGSEFCNRCGTAVFKAVPKKTDSVRGHCPSCGISLSSEQKYCPKCKERNPIYVKNVKSTSVNLKKKKVNLRKLIGWLSVATVLLVGAAFLFIPQYVSDFDVIELYDGTVAVSGYHGKSSEVVVPEQLHFKKITAIAEGAFKNNDQIRNVILPSNVTSIKESAFEDCDRLIQVLMTDNVNSIGKNAFSCCDNLAAITGYAPGKGDTKTKRVKLKVDSIGDGCFIDCMRLVRPLQADDIGVMAYANCNNFRGKLEITATKIGVCAFARCNNITSVDITADVIESAAFESCQKLRRMTISPRLRDKTDVSEDAFNLCDFLNKDEARLFFFIEIDDQDVRTVEDGLRNTGLVGRNAVKLIGLSNENALKTLKDEYSVMWNDITDSNMYTSKDTKILFPPQNYANIVSSAVILQGGTISPRSDMSMTYRQLFEVYRGYDIIQDSNGEYGFTVNLGKYALSFFGESGDLDSSPSICWISML